MDKKADGCGPKEPSLAIAKSQFVNFMASKHLFLAVVIGSSFLSTSCKVPSSSVSNSGMTKHFTPNSRSKTVRSLFFVVAVAFQGLFLQTYFKDLDRLIFTSDVI
jgi:hypothetical protein